MQKNKAPIAMLVNNNKKNFFASLSVLCASSGLAIANDSTDCGINPFYQDHPLLCAKPELGVDFGFTRTQFKQDQGDKMLNRNQFPINFFFGFNVTERFGVEVGYGETRRKHKQVTLEVGEHAPGLPLIAGAPKIYDTYLSVNQPYVSIKYKYPIGNKFHLFGALGITAMKINAAWEHSTPAQSNTIMVRKNIPLIRAGIYYQINLFLCVSLQLIFKRLNLKNIY